MQCNGVCTIDVASEIMLVVNRKGDKIQIIRVMNQRASLALSIPATQQYNKCSIFYAPSQLNITPLNVNLLHLKQCNARTIELLCILIMSVCVMYKTMDIFNWVYVGTQCVIYFISKY